MFKNNSNFNFRSRNALTVIRENQVLFFSGQYLSGMICGKIRFYFQFPANGLSNLPAKRMAFECLSRMKKAKGLSM